jgi:hypothetical protein
MLGRLILTGFAALIGFAVGYAIGMLPYINPMANDYPDLAEMIPLPHHVPEHSGGISFRFAMAHDVIHERFPKHGQAHYRERDRLTRQELAKLGPDDPAALPLLDDLAAGLERLGKSSEAVEVMRDKLARQRKQGVQGLGLYTTYANLGTFLIHSSFKPAMAGDSEAKARFREGVEFVRESVKVNPEAHFGRERWQAAIAEFLLASMDDPKLLTTFDCLGNRLDSEIEALLARDSNWVFTGYGRPTAARFASERTFKDVPAFFLPDVDVEDPKLWPELRKIRDQIIKVGAEGGWDEVPVPSHRVPVPFDEPTLGIIGMWRQGGGANPHFCLALGETMLRVGQRPIAWAAFERASRLADRYWPDKAIQTSLREHCRKRQAQIEETMKSEVAWKRVSPSAGPAAIANLRGDFDRELAVGEEYQRAYQAYEETKIKAGFSITDEHFFDKFTLEHPSIASQPGPEEWFAWVSPKTKAAYGAEQGKVFGIFGAGVAASLAACCFWLPSLLRNRTRGTTTQDSGDRAG